MNGLIVPFAFAGFQIERHNAFAEQSVAGAVSAVVIAGGKFDWQIQQAQLFIYCHLTPHAGIAGVISRVFFPCVVTEFAGPGNGVEDPQAFTGAHVKAAHIALHIAFGFGEITGQVRGAHNDGVSGDGGGGMQPDFAGDGINLLVVFLFQVDHTAFAEAGNQRTGLRIKANQHITGRDVEDAVVRLAVGPVGEAPTGETAGRRVAARAFIQTV